VSLFEDTNPRALKELLSEINNRTMVLPDFQRDFVWEPGATQELVVSIANNYPAGSILRVRESKHVFAAREFEGAPALGKSKYTFLVLDGQQRLTSLYQAFYGVGEHRYFIDLKKLTHGADFEEAIFHLRATSKAARDLEAFTTQSTDLLLPLSMLKNGSGGFAKWGRKVARELEQEPRIALEDALDRVEEKWIQTIDDYHFPVVTLADKTDADALCTIFETLNRTGVKLSVFELLTARFWPQDIKLRALWDKAVAEHPILADFDVDPYSVLQAISLASREAPSCKRSDVLNMAASDIKMWWDKCVRGLADALEILRDDCSVMLPKWLPYQTVLAPLAAVLAKTGTLKTAASGARREKLKRWFWCSVFGQTYESAANSQAAKDVGEIIPWLAGASAPESVEAFRFDPKALYDVTPRQRAIYRGAICLILGGGARDFHTQALITGKLMEAEGIDDHHVFPWAYLKRNGIEPGRLRDCILNRTLIDRTTNQMISDRAPSDYLTEIKSTLGFPFDSVLRSHTLPIESNSPLMLDDYESFLEWRQGQLWDAIKRVTGVKSASQLEVEHSVS
jgi:hypothetical protein